jgi:hypothetical protein
MRMGAAGAWPGTLIAVLLLAGCSSGDGPQGALDDFADAVNERDDAAVRELVCRAARPEGGPGLADPFEGSGYDVDRIDARLRKVRWVAEAGEVTEQGDGRATGTLTFTVEGTPDDLSAEAQQVLDVTSAPFPVGLAGEDGTVTLVEEDGEWRVCDETAGAAAGDSSGAAGPGLQLRPVLEKREPRVVAAPAAPAPAAAPADLETLATAGCGSLPAQTDGVPAGEPLVTCSATGDVAYRLGPVEVPHEQIVEVRAVLEPSTPGSWVVLLKASGPGKAAIADLTGRLAAQQPPLNELAVVVDGVVETSPAVQEPITGGELQISGRYDSTTARDLVTRITG